MKKQNCDNYALNSQENGVFLLFQNTGTWHGFCYILNSCSWRVFMPKHFKMLFLLLFLPLASHLYAVSPPAATLTLEEAITIAVAHNDDLQKQALDLADKTRRKNAALWNWALPSVSVSGGISNTQPINPAGDTTSSWNASGSIGLNFTTAIPPRVALEETKYKISELTFTHTRSTLIKTVSVTFYTLLAEKENIEILKTNLELLKNQYEQAEQNYNRGLSPELDLLNAQYAYQVAGPELKNAINDYERHLADYLLSVLGLDPDEYTGTELSGDIETKSITLPAGETLAAAFSANHFDVMSQSLALSQSELNAKIQTTSSLSPTLSLSESIRMSPPQIAGFSFDDPATTGTFSLTLSIPISSFVPGSSSSLDIMTARDSASLAQSTLETTRKKAEEDIKQKRDTLLRTGESIELTQLNYRISLRAYELSEQGYTRGLVSATDLQASRQRMISARQAVVQAEVSYLSGSYELASALNLDIAEFYERYANH
jgi:outer membrane protein TolC